VAWSCAVESTGGRCFSPEQIAAYALPASKSLEIPATDLETLAEAGQVLLFRLALQQGERSAAASVRLSLTAEADVPVVSVVTQQGDVLADGSTRVRRDRVLRLSGQVTGKKPAYEYAWSETTGSLDLTDPDNLLTPTTGKSLAVPANRLRSGATYEFELVAWPKGRDPAVVTVGRASIGITVNTAPSSGACWSEPNQGTAFNTSFILQVLLVRPPSSPTRLSCHLSSSLSAKLVAPPTIVRGLGGRAGGLPALLRLSAA